MRGDFGAYIDQKRKGRSPGRSDILYFDELHKEHIIFDNVTKTVWLQWYNLAANVPRL